MYKIFLTLFVAGVVCRPQSRALRPNFFQTPGATSRSSSGSVPELNFEQQSFPVQTPLHSRSQLSRDAEDGDYNDELEDVNAKYEFSSNIDDHISDQMQRREEVRDGGTVKGLYSYSDGHYKISVEYIADKDGYRVLKMDSVPLNGGPHADTSGSASVSSFAHGHQLQYKVVSVPSSPGSLSKTNI